MENGDKKKSKLKNLRFVITFILGVAAVAAIISSEQATTPLPAQTAIIATGASTLVSPTDPTIDTDTANQDTSDQVVPPPPAITPPNTAGQFIPPPNPNANNSATTTDSSDTSTDPLDSLQTASQQNSTDPTDDQSATTTDDTTATQPPSGATAECTDGTYSYDSDPTTACGSDGGIQTIL